MPNYPQFPGAGVGVPSPGHLPAPPSGPRQNPILVVLVLVLGLALVTITTGLYVNSRHGSAGDTAYQNEDYQAPPPAQRPPPLPNPTDRVEARKLLEGNALYAQVAPRPIRCDLADFNPKTATRAQTEQHLSELTACLMKEWDGVLSAAGYRAVRPQVTIYNGAIDSPCGRITTNPAFYCPADQGIYFPETYGKQMPPRASTRLTVLAVIAHEFGHAIQGRTGILSAQYALSTGQSREEKLADSRRVELQASCFGGRFIGALAQSMAITDEERAALIEGWKLGGDDAQANDPNAVGDHGLGATQVRWLTAGMDTPGPLSVCNTWIAPDDQVR